MGDILPVARKIALAQGLVDYNLLQVRLLSLSPSVACHGPHSYSYPPSCLDSV